MLETNDAIIVQRPMYEESRIQPDANHATHKM